MTSTNTTYQLLIQGMSCASCVQRVKHALTNVSGSQEVQVSLAQQQAWVTGQVKVEALVAAVNQLGYQAQWVTDARQSQQLQRQQQRQQQRRLAWQSVLALLLAAGLMIAEMHPSFSITSANQHRWLTVGIVTFILMIVTGKHFYQAAWQNLRQGHSTMDSLISLGTLAALGYSLAVSIAPLHFPIDARHLYYEASLMIIGLINLGRFIELRVKQHTSTTLEKLLSLTPSKAKVIDKQGNIQLLAQQQLQIGMRIQLSTGDRLPIDGVISQGEIWLNSAMLTGENQPTLKKPGDKVWAGTLVDNGSAQLTATHCGEQTQLARIIQLVQQAQNSQPAISGWIDKIAAIFVPCVLVIALISGLIWYYFGPAPQIIYSFIISCSVLIIACPCALGLAIPMSIIAGIGRAAELGILIRDANVLQAANQLDTLIFDKTGTLTEGHPQVQQFIRLSNHSSSTLLSWAMALEMTSYHPLGQAIIDYVKKQQPALTASDHQVSEVNVYRGLGIAGRINGSHCYLGSPQLLQQQQIDITALVEQMPDWQQQAHSLVLLAVASQLAAVFVIDDRCRDDSTTAIHQLQQLGYHIQLLSGDQTASVEQLANQLHITDYQALCLPEDKVNAIQQWQQQGHHVAMIGDGINDAPALAQANISIALNTGSDIAIETAAITLLQNKLSLVAQSLQLTKAIERNMRQNLLAAFIYNVLSIPIAAGLLYPINGFLLNPMLASAAMALSSVSVLLNASRLCWFKTV